MKELKGSVGVVTGAASGIGRAVAEAFAASGMKVVLADIETQPLQAACHELSAAGYEVLGVPTDVSDPTAIEHLASATLDRFERVDVVHNNAGVVASGLAEEIPLESWRWVLEVDLWSVIYGVRTFLPIMKEQRSGHIINTASTAGLQANAGIAPYNVAKFGVVALSETLRLECEGSGVGISVLCPGAVNTSIVHAERNRPPDVPPSLGPTAQRFQTVSAELLSTKGLPPASVAEMVLDAIRTDRFWVLTHPEWLTVLEQRLAGLADGTLIHGFGG
jgi:NAD(P)-dependent dehydrogenase (short-subunit alcohol dehydrogenase family)